MKIKKQAQAGSMESSDVMVFVQPENNLKIEIRSSVSKQYGKSIEKVLKDILNSMNIDKGYIKIQDSGAIEPTLRARIVTAIKRGI